MGSKDLRTPTHLIPSPRPTSRSKKCPRTDGENPGLQIVRSKTVASSTGHNHGREKRHITQGGPPEDHEGDSRPYGLAIGGWWRDNSRRSHHLRIKYTYLTLWPRWCGCDPWTTRWGPQLLTERQKEVLDGTDTQVATCMINRWTTKMKGAEGYITRETSRRRGMTVRKTPESSSREVSEEEKKNSSSNEARG